MKKNQSAILLAAITVSAIATLALVVNTSRVRKRIAESVSEEGYETARDILYPNKYSIRKLHYGPVLPS